MMRSGDDDDELKESEIAPIDDVYGDELAFHDNCLLTDEREIDDLVVIVDFKVNLLKGRT